MKHIPIPPDPFPHFRLGNMANSATAGLVHAQRAFEGHATELQRPMAPVNLEDVARCHFVDGENRLVTRSTDN